VLGYSYYYWILVYYAPTLGFAVLDYSYHYWILVPFRLLSCWSMKSHSADRRPLGGSAVYYNVDNRQQVAESVLAKTVATVTVVAVVWKYSW